MTQESPREEGYLACARAYIEAADIVAAAPEALATLRRFIERKGYTEDEDMRRQEENPARHHFGWDKAPEYWPWDVSEWQPRTDVVGNLELAQGFIGMEIDRRENRMAPRG